MLNVITLFSGYDSQALALNRLGLPYDLAAWCEIDRHAITAHNALFPQWKDRNLGDVSKVDWTEWHRRHPQPIDLLTYSSPCQDFSSAGLQRGGEEGSGTRSGLLWETERAVRELRPRHLVFENVGGLVSDKFIDLFQRWQVRLNGYGYTNFSQLMNAKDYGVPQNRLRIFMVSILDCRRAYYFPQPFPLTRRLKDVLEQNVAERYYLSDEQVAKLMQETAIHSDRGNGFAFRPHTPEEIASTVKCSGIGDKTDNFVAEPKINIIGQLSSSQNSRIIGTEGISPAVINGEKDGMPKIVEPVIAAMRGRDKDNPNDRGKSTDNYTQRLEPSADQSTSNTITSVAKDNLLIVPPVMQIGNLKDDSERNFKNPQTGRGYSSEGLSPTINTCQGGQCVPQIVELQMLGWTRNEKGEITDRHPVSVANCVTAAKRDNTQNYVIEATIIDTTNSCFEHGGIAEHENVCPTIRSQRTGLLANYGGIRIRRLTERELYRLMDVDEEDIDTLLAAPIPRTQHAKLAGNSIVVACLYHIFRNLFVDTQPTAGVQTMLF